MITVITDFNLGLKGLVRALGFLPSYHMNDKVKAFTECYHIREQALTVNYHCSRGVDKITIRHTGRNRVDVFIFTDNDRLVIQQVQGKVINDKQLYNRLFKCAERVLNIRSMRQVISDQNHYYNHNSGSTK